MQESGHVTEISCHDYFMQNRIQTHQNQSQRQSMKSLLLSKPAPRLWPRLLRRKPGNQPDGLLLYTWGASIDVHGGWSDPETSRIDPQKRDHERPWEENTRKYGRKKLQWNSANGNRNRNSCNEAFEDGKTQQAFVSDQVDIDSSGTVSFSRFLKLAKSSVKRKPEKTHQTNHHFPVGVTETRRFTLGKPIRIADPWLLRVHRWAARFWGAQISAQGPGPDQGFASEVRNLDETQRAWHSWDDMPQNWRNFVGNFVDEICSKLKMVDLYIFKFGVCFCTAQFFFQAKWKDGNRGDWRILQWWTPSVLLSAWLSPIIRLIVICLSPGIQHSYYNFNLYLCYKLNKPTKLRELEKFHPYFRHFFKKYFPWKCTEVASVSICFNIPPGK